MIQRSLTFLFLLLNTFAYSQQLTHVQGEVIVQFHPKIDNIQPLLQRLNSFNGRKSKIKSKKCLSESMNIWVLKFDFTSIPDRRFLSIIRKDRLVQIAQFNHIIQYRNTPNDPEFFRQWQYLNDGSEGGNMEADLDADLAWDITTGGVTANGDTIVLAALDDGVDTNHEDFGNNLWRNHKEIPNNGIDDDNNGYIDDVNGWNVVSGDGILTGGAHGTPVMGIMGAKGNNEIGVTGISWEVKVMMIQTDFGSDEATLIEGYGYPLAMRKLYNETNGEEGAFVVATNASWGTDNGKAEDAPIWCALYDSLGAVGILNCGATANENINVDKDGDLPTTCPSDYLIGVTNINRSGEKELFAGYGKEHIDIGAFGENAYTLARGSRYAPFGGTSGATPHVTGAIGLLYSAPCRNFANLAKSNPAQTALLVKEYILNGVKPNESLDTITVTGGQLNLNNSLQLLMQSCGPCPSPLAISVSSVIDTTVEVSWVSSMEETKADLRYRTDHSMDWIVISGVNTPYSLTDLVACTNYEFQIKSECGEETSGYSRTYTFKTDGCCTPPLNIRVSEVGLDQIKIEWDALFAANSYEVRFNAFGNDILITPTDTTFILFDGLTSCTNYEFQVRTICTNMTTDFSAIQNAQTKGCGSCTDLAYCAGKGDGEFEWISKVELNTLSNESGTDIGYGDYTGFSTDLNTLEKYELTVTVSYETFPFAENLQVWIDFNQDGVFDEENENVVDLEEDFIDESKTEITIPPTAIPGLTRMRIAVKWREGPNTDKASPCLEYDFGEMEDYCVNIIQTTEPCFVPEELKLLDEPLANVAVVSWNDGLGALSYNYRYKIASEEDWTMANSVDKDAVFLNDLSPCSSYELQVQSLCDSMKTSEYSSSFLFNTKCDCLPPTNIILLDSTLNTLRIAWDVTDFADKYEVLYKDAGGTNQRRTIVNTNEADLFALSECTSYAISVRGFCLDSDGSFSDLFSASTSCKVAVNTLPTDVEKITIYPNPFQTQLQVEIDLKKRSDLRLQLFDITGKLLKINVMESVNAGFQKVGLDFGAIDDGVYLLSIETEEGKTMRRVVKM